MPTKKKATSKKSKLRNLPKKALTAKQAKSVKGGGQYLKWGAGVKID